MQKKQTSEGSKDDSNRDGKQEDSVCEDQKRHEYYYDDAHGYEEFDPESDEDDVDGDS